MSLEGVLEKAKDEFVEQWNYSGKKENILRNGAEFVLGCILFDYFDDISLELVCGAYAVLKGIHLARDIIRMYKEYGSKNSE